MEKINRWRIANVNLGLKMHQQIETQQHRMNKATQDGEFMSKRKIVNFERYFYNSQRNYRLSINAIRTFTFSYFTEFEQFVTLQQLLADAG